MIQAVIFDLDGTLVQTERLKALSYARAAVELCPYRVSEEQILEAYKEVVGLPRREVALMLVKRFDLEQKARARMDEFGVDAPWQAFVQVRLGYYKDMISDPEILRENQSPHTLGLLQMAREMGCKSALATMSGCAHPTGLAGAGPGRCLRLRRREGRRGTREAGLGIYQLVCRELRVSAGQSLAIEDSPSGVEAALATGLHCIAVATPFTRERLHDQNLLEAHWIVDDPVVLPDVVRQMIEQSRWVESAIEF
jgi:beta-phosphoglucomutase-like phosphatase (HAD superfamily)